jgi:hypothetical protein
MNALQKINRYLPPPHTYVLLPPTIPYLYGHMCLRTIHLHIIDDKLIDVITNPINLLMRKESYAITKICKYCQSSGVFDLVNLMTFHDNLCQIPIVGIAIHPKGSLDYLSLQNAILPTWECKQ